MKLLKLFCKSETATPMLALTFASAVCVALVLGRIAWTWQIRYAFLIWNHSHPIENMHKTIDFIGFSESQTAAKLLIPSHSLGNRQKWPISACFHANPVG